MPRRAGIGRGIKGKTMSRRRVCAVIAVLMALSTARSEADASNAPAPGDEQQVIATETAWVDAEVKRDAAVLNRVLDERFLVNSSTGVPRDKASVIADVLSWKMVSQAITDRTVLVDGDTAIVFGTATFRFAVEGKDDERSAARYTTTYIKRDGRWRALALHMTTLKAS
jgi:hypothetical protein